MDKNYANMSDEELDKLFRDALKQHIPPGAPEGAWENFRDNFLNKAQEPPVAIVSGTTTKRMPAWWLAAASILLIAGLGWWWMSSGTRNGNNIAGVTPSPHHAVQLPVPADSAGSATQPPIALSPQPATNQLLAMNEENRPVNVPGEITGDNNTAGTVPEADNNIENGVVNPGQPANAQPQSFPVRPDENKVQPEKKAQVNLFPFVQSATKRSRANDKWQIGVVLGSNLGMVKGDVSNKAGFNGGVVVQRKLGGSRFSLESGVMYESMAYSVNNDDFNPGGKPVSNKVSNIEGTCSMIDVPVNVRYDVVQSKKNKAFISTGVSPTVIVNQSYVYDYAGNNGTVYVDRDVSGRGKNAYAVANVSIGYEQKWHNISVQVAPYVKIPMGEIGYGNINLGGVGGQVSIKKNL